MKATTLRRDRELAAVIAEGAFYDLDAPVKRMGAMHVPIPFSPRWKMRRCRRSKRIRRGQAMCKAA